MRAAAFALAVFLWPAFVAAQVTAPTAANVDCKTIADPNARLACFDKSPPKAATKPAATVKPAGAQAAAKPAPGAIVDAGWELRISKDSFSDKTTCVISPTGKPYIQITVGHLYISYAGKGGVAGFTPRLDDLPAEQMQLPTPIEKQISAVHFGGNRFYEVMAANRLRVQTLTVLQDLKTEDLQLEPAKRLYKQIPPVCGA